ncbi:MAG TPA: uroporphyrinogen decarboxylase [Candidatus Pelethocola excrementipullorum]|nr:uroporphyrinogen decarboxylase [Candidatus Pelethocola excrementipullorum]
MLTKRENLLETIRGGNPDRFVNQYEYLNLVFDPTVLAALGNCPRGESAVNGWGVMIRFPENVPGPFPDTSGEFKVIKDVVNWRDYVKAPEVKFPEEDWAPFVAAAEAVDRKEQFVAPFAAPGIFEKLHYLMGMEEAMMAFYEEPEAMHELVDFLADYEISAAKEVIAHLHPDALFHHDDWGSQISSFLSPEMFGEFIAPAYKKIYGFWKANGVELIVHHSDSYAANLVPYMIDCDVDIWQGVMSTNNIPELIQKYGGQISFHAGIDNGKVDRVDWTKENIMKEVEAQCRACGKLYYIPGTTMGGPESTYPGVYEAVSEAIDEMTKKMF